MRAGTNGLPLEPRGTRPIRVLIVDDEPLMREILGELLQDIGYLVVGEASNGALAVEMARETHPDMVLMDLKMPVMDGIEATAAITRELGQTVVIVLSAYDDASLQRLAREAGAHTYVLKGARIEVIEEALREASDALRR
jgi:DNA-binding NarL/FixJ family response regulator